MYDLGDVSVEAVAVRSFGGSSGGDRPSGDLCLARPLRFGALDRVDCGAVQGEPGIPAKIRAFARVRHRAEDQFTVLEGRRKVMRPASERPAATEGQLYASRVKIHPAGVRGKFRTAKWAIDRSRAAWRASAAD